MKAEVAPILTAKDAHLYSQRAAKEKTKAILVRISDLINQAITDEKMTAEYIWDTKVSPLVKNSVLSTLLEYGYATTDYPPTQMERGYTIINWENPQP